MSKINTRVIVWMVVVVVVVAGLIWYAVSMRGPASPGGGQQTEVPVYAPQGQVVQGFPRQLILDNAAIVNNSYSINYSVTTNQYTVQWNSSSSMMALYNAYKQYLPANGWTITNADTKYAAIHGLYATNASSDVSIVIATQKGGSLVGVTYLAK